MRKFIIVLTILVLFSLVAYGATTAEKSLGLSFSGTTAKCSAKVSQYGASISVTMYLYKGTTLIDSWNDSGTNRVTLNGTHSCVSGQTYTLQADVTIDGVPVSVSPVTKNCP